MRRAASRRGFTVIEVIMALGIFAIGASAVIAMQRGTVLGNADARKLDMANTIAREWIERLRRDATLWTTPSSLNPNSNYGNAKLLSTYLPFNAAGTVTAWTYPDALLSATPAVPDGLSPAFDILGRDLAVTNVAASTVFCVNIRLNWLVMNSLIRAEVRVAWPRLIINEPSAGWCSETNAANITSAVDTYHFVYAATAIRQNPDQ